MALDSQNKIIEAQLRDCFGRVAYSHKTQEKCADILTRRHNCIKIAQIIISAIITTGVLITVFGENQTVGIVTAFLSAILFTINTYTKGHDLGEIAQKHSDAASDLWDIREKYLSLIKSDNRKHVAMLEFVKDDNIDIFLADSATLKRLCS